MTRWHRRGQHHPEGAGRTIAATPPPGEVADPGRVEAAAGPEAVAGTPRAGADPRSRSAGVDYAPGRHEPRAGDPVVHHGAGYDYDVDWASEESWQQRSRLVVTPIAAPSILGLMGFAGATFMIASNLAGWWGNATTTPLVLAPFAATFGGLAQFLAGMWAYRARDGVATAMHGTWGAFWLAYGLLATAVATGHLPAAVMASRAFGFWFIVLCVVTFFGALGALRSSLALFAVLGLLTVGSGLLAAGLVGGYPGLVHAAGWVLVFSAGAAFYTAGAMMLQHAWNGRVVLPTGEWSGAHNVPTRQVMVPVQYPAGMPGSRVGQ